MNCPDGHPCFVEITLQGHGRLCVQAGCQAANFTQHRRPAPIVEQAPVVSDKTVKKPRKRVRVKL